MVESSKIDLSSNTAKQVASILRLAMEQVHPSESVSQALSLGTSTSNEPSSKFLDFCVLLWRLEKDLEKIKGSDKRVPLKKLQSQVLQRANSEWASLKADIEQGNFLYFLDNYSDVLDEKFPIPGLDEDYIDRLIAHLEALMDETRKSNLDQKIKLFVIEQLEEICRVLRRYSVLGSEGVRDVVDASLTHLSWFYQSNAQAKAQRETDPILRRFGAFLVVMSIALGQTASYVGLASDTESYLLPKMERFWDDINDNYGDKVDNFFHHGQKLLPLAHDDESQDSGSKSSCPRVPETNIRVQTIVIASKTWGWSTAQVAEEYSLTGAQVEDALEIYQANSQMIDDSIAAEQKLEEAVHG
jgi:uncharacterized protein (DUF433 family)